MQNKIRSFFQEIVPHVHREGVRDDHRSIDFDVIVSDGFVGFVKIYEHYDGVTVTAEYNRSSVAPLESVDLLNLDPHKGELTEDEVLAIYWLVPDVVNRLKELKLDMPSQIGIFANI